MRERLGARSSSATRRPSRRRSRAPSRVTHRVLYCSVGRPRKASSRTAR
jgi:hypothetical protein